MSEPTMTVRDEEAEALARGEVARRGRALYEAQLRAVLEPEYNNRFVAIHPDSGEYAVADSTGNAMRAIRKSRPQGRLYLTKIGPEPEYGLTARILMVCRASAGLLRRRQASCSCERLLRQRMAHVRRCLCL